jgi:hypothetical protein
MATPLPLPAVLVLLTITADPLLHGLFGPALQAGSQRSAHPGLPLRGPGHCGHAFGSHPTSARSRPRHHAHCTVPRSWSPRTFPPGSRPRLMPGLGHDP